MFKWHARKMSIYCILTPQKIIRVLIKVMRDSLITDRTRLGELSPIDSPLFDYVLLCDSLFFVILKISSFCDNKMEYSRFKTMKEAVAVGESGKYDSNSCLK